MKGFGGFLRGLIGFLSNSFFIGSEIEWFKRLSGKFFTSALFRLLFGDFQPIFCVPRFWLFCHSTATQPESNATSAMGLIVFFWIAIHRCVVYKPCKPSVLCLTYSRSRLSKPQKSTFF